MDRRAFMGLLGLGGASLVPVCQLWKEGDEPRASGVTLEGSQTIASPGPRRIFSIKGGQCSAASNDFTIAKSRMEVSGLLADGTPGVWWDDAECPTEFVQIYRDLKVPGGFSSTMQRDVPVGYYDDYGKLRAARQNSFVLYFLDRSLYSRGTALTIGQAQYDSLALAEAAIFQESTVFISAIASVHTCRTIIIAKADVLGLSDRANVKFIEVVTAIPHVG